MNLNSYQEASATTALYPNVGRNFTYPTIGLAGEVGEVFNQIKKAIRDNQGEITSDRRSRLADELGDVLWYLAMLCTELSLSLDVVAASNLNKLALRKKLNTITGAHE